MEKQLVGLWVLGIALFLGGCTTARGPDAILSAHGVTSTVVGTSGVTASFLNAASKSAAKKEDPVLAEAMLRSGFALVYANCSDFFLTAGENQKWLIVTRDTVGAVGTLATGVMSLHNASKNAVANMAFLTGATFAGLDIYTKNFLFAAENVDSVRTLISRALNVHQTAVLAQGPFTYDSASMMLMDHQNICTPMPIAALAKEAIKKGNVVPDTQNATDPGGLAKIQNDIVLEKLGALLNPPSALTMEQAVALWWLFQGSPTPDEKKNLIAPRLQGLQSSPLDASGAYVLGWTKESAVRTALKEFSAPTQASLTAAVLELKKLDKEAQAAKAKADADALAAATEKKRAQDELDAKNKELVKATAVASSPTVASAPDKKLSADLEVAKAKTQATAAAEALAAATETAATTKKIAETPEALAPNLAKLRVIKSLAAPASSHVSIGIR